MFEKIKYKSIVLSSIIFVLCFAYNASAADINATANIVGNITVTEISALDFGQFSSGASAGTVTFPTSGPITATAGIVLLGGEINGIAQLDMSGAGAGPLVTVTITGTTLTGPGSMLLQANCEGPGGVAGALDSPCTFTSAGGTANVVLGGELTVAANQPAGVYSGFITVTAAF